MNEGGLTRRQAFLVLNGLPLMGPVTLRRLLERFGEDPVAVLGARARDLQAVPDVGPAVAEAITGWREHFPLEKEETQIRRLGAAVLNPEDAEYPELLRRIYDPPISLYWKGEYRLTGPAVAIVGSRHCTVYGLNVARRLAGELARAGFCIVSGMARGIDRAAHEGALEAGGKTLAVFGNGLDIVYPAENIDLYRAIPENGALVSEFPLGKKANRTTFPMRNRVVSGICQGIIVVETDVEGGSMITAKFAAEQNRTVFAVPGRIDQASSAGCLQLIKDGAVMVTGVEDVLEELGYRQQFQQEELFAGGESKAPAGEGGAEAPAAAVAAPPGGSTGPELGENERRVLACFRGGEAPGRDEIGEATGLSAGAVGATLMMLEIKRLVVKRADGRFERL